MSDPNLLPVHLWEIRHPYYGADGYPHPCESFEELRDAVNACDEGMNHVYRWDWYDPQHPINDGDFFAGEDRASAKQTFTVFIVQPRKSSYIQFACPVTHDDEPAVLEWLRGPRVLGSLAKLWAPILDGAA